MKVLILCDNIIDREQSKQVDKDFDILIRTHAGITPTFIYEDFDFTTYPKETAADGDEHITDAWLRSTIATVFKKHGDNIDHVILQIHRNNWNLAGIWGTNYSNIYNGYQVHVCRFDHRNLANSLGTRYHEWMHSLDAIIKTYVGTDVSKTIGLSWDKFVVHGGRPDKENTTEWKYIRWKDNTKALELIQVDLRQAYVARHKIANQKTLIGVLQKLVVAYRQLINQKSTIKK